MSRLPEHLRQAVRARTEAAEKRARVALATMAKAREPISFAAVARIAAVSTDFLYRHLELRTLIERHRKKSGAGIGARPDPQPSESSTSAAVRALSARLSQQQREHREEVARLRKALEVAQGENLALRRKLAEYE
ncbi:DUF6262 family protein [Streptomyces collinus]|uniref:DUF6262 family protein n=1 Tax=Streptomyces collinus TaxID=42684 RepID=UPI0036788A84